MPGKRANECNWFYLTALQEYRTVVGGSVDVKADLDAVDAGEPVVAPLQPWENTTAAFNNLLHLGIILDSSVTGTTVQIYVDMDPGSSSLNRWCKMAEEDFTVSGLLTLRDVPPQTMKILVTAITGSGSVKIIEQHSL